MGPPHGDQQRRDLANVPHIIDHGGQWYSGVGVPHSTGTKIFSLVGKVKNSGLVEVPMGITLGAIVEEIGGGVPGKERFKAVQTGGPSGGIIPYEFKELPPEDLKLDKVGLQPRGFMPTELKNLPVDFDSLAQAGSIMGSGGMIVMDETSCMVDVARYFMSFLHDESCGKCTPCREGTKHLLEILTEITKGNGQEEHIPLMEELCDTMAAASLCGLGQSAVNPVRSTLKYFREEYEAHILHKKCPALVCRPLLKYTVDPETCTGCLACVRECPVDAIHGEAAEPQLIDQELCVKCGMCHAVCKFDAVKVES